MFGKKDWKEAVIHIEGMHCGMCSARMQKAFLATKGVKEAEVDLETKTAHIVYDGGKLDENALKQLVTDTGYTPV